MFTKVFVFFLLGSTLILAHPVQDNIEEEFDIDEIRPRGLFSTFQWWLVKADDTINAVSSAVYDRVVTPVKKAVKMAVETGEGVMDYTKEKVEQLTDKYYEIRSKSEENLNTLKNNFIVKVIEELQHTIDVLSKQTDAETLEKLKEKMQELAESSKTALDKLQQKLQASILAEKQKLEENLDDWKRQADKATKKRQIS